MTLINHRVVGTAGLSKKNDTEYELVKMAVDPAKSGRGIGKILLNHCVEPARKLDAEKLGLFSNSQLQTALKLVEKFGFIYVEVAGTPMLTADVNMELSLIIKGDQ